MNNIDDFVESSVKIELQKESGKYGYFPFYMFVETEEGEYVVICIAGVNSVEDCYLILLKYVRQKAKRIYMALDFPPGGDIENDFVGVFKYEKKEFDVFGIPYDDKTGAVYERVINKNQMLKICRDLFMCALKSRA